MDRVKEAERQQRIQELIDEYGLDGDEAAFAVALSNGETQGCIVKVTLPFPDDKARFYEGLLVEQLGFTPEEAARYVAGDRTAIDPVFERRRRESPAPARDEAAVSTDQSLLTAG